MFADRRVIFSNLEGRENELAALMARFKVSGYQRFAGVKPMPDFFFITDRIDFFLAQLCQAGFEFEERAGWKA
jgi:hypothetical protein